MYHFAIIGCGAVAEDHAAAIKKIGKLVAVCDIDPVKAEQMAMRHGARSYSDTAAMLENEMEAEIICICTPVGCHAEHAIRSLQSGRHVICESPLCLTIAGAWQMIETEKYCRRKLQVVDLIGENRQLETIRKKLKDQKPLSFHFTLTAFHDDNYYRGWRGSVFPGGGLLYTDFSDDISVLAGIFGAPGEVEGFASNLAHRDTIEFEDAGAVALRTVKGWRGKISWSVNKNEGRQLVLQHAEGETGLDLQELSNRDYDSVYERFLHVMSEDLPSNLHEATKTVEAIEKIYKALTPNPA